MRERLSFWPALRIAAARNALAWRRRPRTVLCRCSSAVSAIALRRGQARTREPNLRMAAMKAMDRGVSNFQAPTSVKTPRKRVPVLTLA